MHFALYGRNFGNSAMKRVERLLEHLSGRGVGFSLYTDLYECVSKAGMTFSGTVPVFSSSEDMPAGVDAVLALGGDGTFLGSLAIVRDSGIPVAGINFGRLGFLASAGSGDAGCGIVDNMLEGRYIVEQRTLLELSCEGLPEDFYPYALNEVTLQRSGPNMVGIDVVLDGMKIPTYWADGLLVATPTGSTAYSLSVGGPVVVPGSSVFVVAPIASHNLNVRPLIIPDGTIVDVRMRSNGHATLLSADNRPVTIEEGQEIVIKKAGFSISCVSFAKEDFMRALNEKLLWGEDRRNDGKVNN